MEIIFILIVFLILVVLNDYKVRFSKENNTRTIYNMETFQMSLSWLIPIIGILGYILVYSNIIKGNELKEIIIKVSDVSILR
jgi:hypothetical protein